MNARAYYAMGRMFAVMLFMALAWLSVPTSVFISDASYAIDDRRVTLTRETPFGSINARFFQEIVVVKNGLECRNPAGWQTAEFQVKENNYIQYDLGNWVEPCIHDGAYILKTVRQAYLFGLIPLRTSATSVIVDG